MANLELYVDPVCPFAWVTSRWLQATGRESKLRQMSLAVLNEGRDVDSAHRPKLEWSRRLGRVFAAATAENGPDAFGELYEAFGPLVHSSRHELTDTALKEALGATNCSPALIEALDDPSWDDAVRASHQRSQEALGGSGGSPIIVVDGRGFFGPVLTSIPNCADGTALLDAVLKAAAIPGFAALQRPYQGPPSMTPEETHG